MGITLSTCELPELIEKGAMYESILPIHAVVIFTGDVFLSTSNFPQALQIC